MIRLRSIVREFKRCAVCRRPARAADIVQVLEPGCVAADEIELRRTCRNPSRTLMFVLELLMMQEMGEVRCSCKVVRKIAEIEQ
eukprot:5239659-Amphidinium_carterae.1